MIVVEGKGGIVARVLKDSISKEGVRLVTYEVEFPRYILSEYNTHRVLSRNAASTRAIPILRMLEQIADSPAMPIYYGKNQAGMSASVELSEGDKAHCEAVIDEMRRFCMTKVATLSEIGLHKQHSGRYLEPWQMVKGVVTSTEWSNWFWLRNHSAAQPEIAELARCMWGAAQQSTPTLLQPGEYHLPYVDYMRRSDTGELMYGDDGNVFLQYDLEDAIKISCARCAAVSYRKTDYDLVKSREVFDRLVGEDRKHSSSMEHCASPLEYLKGAGFPYGATHLDRNGNYWSGNLKGWLQYRQTIKGHNYTEDEIDVGAT